MGSRVIIYNLRVNLISDSFSGFMSEVHRLLKYTCQFLHLRREISCMQVENVYLMPSHVHKPAIGIHFLHLNVAEEFCTAVELHELQPY